MTSVKHDEETGEVTSRFNCETGEEEFINTSKQQRFHAFKIPPNCTKSSDKKEEKSNPQCSPMFTTAILFLLPTTIFFYPIFACIAVSLEGIIHVWAHRKNKQLKNEKLYYQSPLHIICKEFCGSCREEEAKMKITKFQEKRADKIKKYGLEYVRRIVT